MTPVDPNIALSAVTPQRERSGLLDRYQQYLNLQQLMQRGRMYEEQLKQAEAERKQSEATMREVMNLNESIAENVTVDDAGNVSFDAPAVINSLKSRGSGQAILKFQEMLSGLDTKQLEREEAAVKARREKAKGVSDLLNSAVDQDSWEGAIQKALESNFINEDVAAQLPRDFEEAAPLIRQYSFLANGTEKMLELQEKITKIARDKALWPLQVQEQISKTMEATQKARGIDPELERFHRMRLEADGKPDSAKEWMESYLQYRQKDEGAMTPFRLWYSQQEPGTADIRKWFELQAAGRPTSTATQDREAQAEIIADEIISGRQPPELTRLYGLAGPVRAWLGKKGYNYTEAAADWMAMTRHLGSSNSPQAVAMKRAVDVTFHALDEIIEPLVNQWFELGLASGYRDLNSITIEVAKRMPGKAGEIAQRLQTQINDFVAELSVVYRGGGTPTDDTMELAAENLKTNWNFGQMKGSLTDIRKTLKIRWNSIANIPPTGMTERGREMYWGARTEPLAIEAPEVEEKIRVRNPKTGKLGWYYGTADEARQEELEVVEEEPK